MSQNSHNQGDIQRINDNYEISDDVTIFRYMDFSKFIDIIVNKSLFFM